MVFEKKYVPEQKTMSPVRSSFVAGAEFIPDLIVVEDGEFGDSFDAKGIGHACLRLLYQGHSDDHPAPAVSGFGHGDLVTKGVFEVARALHGCCGIALDAACWAPM